MIFLVRGNPDIDRIEADDWAAAETKLAAIGVGELLGELVEDEAGEHSAVEAKFSLQSDTRIVEGYAAVFGNRDSGGDVIAPGAFTDWLAKGEMPVMLWAHNPKGMPLGRWLSAEQDATGLKMRGELLTTSFADDVYKALKAGALTGLSIGYLVKAQKRSGTTRTLTALDLVEVSFVTFPMNPMARITAVKGVDEIITIRDLEKTLRDLGLSRSDAARVCARYQAKGGQGDPDPNAARIAAIRQLTANIRRLTP